MDECPNSTVTELYIVAFSTYEEGQLVLFIGVLLMYLMTVTGNILIAILICLVPQLHTPMYFFLCNLSVADIAYVSSTLPKLLSIFVTKDNRMSFPACIIQVLWFTLSVISDIFTLTSMSYDRYVAVCKPLQYHLIMNRRMCIIMAALSWLISAVNSQMYAILTSMLSFCSSHKIDHFFCDIKSLYTITTSDTTSREILMLFDDIFLAFLPFSLTIISYVYIISTIVKIHSSGGRFKAFSSCTSHLTTVILFYGPVIFLYVKPQSEHDKEQDKMLSLLYMAVVPMLNPFVYSLRNKEVLGAIRKITRIKRQLLSMQSFEK
ncbi:olfactory receptor 5AR1-like [Pseudophryne corroboree]|uniref:olfactory receptor 5AR1-like n=1 Tax=Pseudophryne corroboree TaxID=495146 RepID=UPI0030812586